MGEINNKELNEVSGGITTEDTKHSKDVFKFNKNSFVNIYKANSNCILARISKRGFATIDGVEQPCYYLFAREYEDSNHNGWYRQDQIIDNRTDWQKLDSSVVVKIFD